MSSTTILSSERRKELSESFGRWFGNQPVKDKALKSIGLEKATAYKIVLGQNGMMPISVFVKLWQETQDRAFLMTAEEQQRCRRFLGKRLERLPPWPNQAQWPTRDSAELKASVQVLVPVQAPVKSVAQPPPEATESLTGIDDLVDLFKIIVRQLKRLSELPANDPKREEARKRLLLPAMELYRNALVLNFKFPAAYIDLIDQFDLVINAFSKGRKP